MPRHPARALMVQGTGSGVGKSLVAMALCRIVKRRGLRVVPFKAQNMSNNAAVTLAGGEIGRAQALQARAAGVQPDVRMNPVLLKPLADTRSDVVVLGRSEPVLMDLPWHDRKARLWPIVTRALDGLRAEADVVVIEGAGSPAETNLRRSDIVNMAVARYADAAVLLVADIDRGGAFAALYGTWSLLEPEDRARIRGFLLNRFRGDPALLAPAPDDLQRRTGIPTVGVVPYTRHHLPEEDAMGLASSASGALTIAAVRLRYLANFDDLDPLAAEPDVHIRWTDRVDGLQDAAAIVIPGTRNTVADLRWLWESGLAAAIRARHRAGVPVVGLCGGYQIMGVRVADPAGIEAGGECAGLGLIDVATELAPVKTTRRVRAAVIDAHGPVRLPATSALEGYEIHHGRSRIGPAARAWLAVGGEPIGAWAPDTPARLTRRTGASGGAWGAYLHGLFHNDEVRDAWLASLRIAPAGRSWEVELDREIDRVADVVERSIDVDWLDRTLWRDAPA